MKLEQIGFYTLSDNRVKNVSINSQMKRCEMIITEHCNFKCPYCRGLKDEIYGTRRIKQLSLREIERNIDLWCEKEPLENIRFSGGEPTLHKDIIKIIEYSKQKGIKRIAISTNGSNKLELYKELIKAGTNDFSISLDACCAEDGDKLAGNKTGSWNIVIPNIKEISKLIYVTIGIVLTPYNIDKTIETIIFAHKLDVSDIRIISAAQYNKPIPGLNKVPKNIRKIYPILNYRINHFLNGRNVRGLLPQDSKKCGLVLDDSVIAGDFHFPCIIYMREKGNAIGRISQNMRMERKIWFENHNCYKDNICSNNCLDVCVDYNNKYREFHFE